MSKRLIFLDTETTGLDIRHHRIWDLAYIVREPDGSEREVQYFLKDMNLAEADPFALNIGKFYERFPNPDHAADPWAISGTTHPGDAAMSVFMDFKDVIIVGAVPWFDAEFLKHMLWRAGLLPTWHYHLVDVETLAAGHAGLVPPWDFDYILEFYGLEYDEAERHTALGDARMAMRLYDAVMAGARP